MREGWKDAKLGEVCTIVAGQSPKGSAYNNHGDGLPFHQGKKYFRETLLGDSNTWTTEITKEAFPGDILMSVRAPVGPINFTNQHMCIGRGLAAIRASEQVDSMFVFHWLSYIQSEIQGNEGAVFASINKQQIESIGLPLPPLSDQKRIVAILDDAFAGIAAAVANTEKNLANARELFESYLNSVFSRQGEQWDSVPLEKHIKFIDYRGKTPNKTQHGLRLITAKNVRMGFLRREPEEFINKDDYDGWMTRGIPIKGDVLFTTEAPLGLVCQLDTGEKVAFAQRIISMQPNREVIDPGYLCFALRSPLVQFRIHEKATGATATGIKASLLKKIHIPLVSMQRQKDIFSRLVSLESTTQELEFIFKQKLGSLAELKQSLLQKAFSGELITAPQDEIRTALA